MNPATRNALSAADADQAMKAGCVRQDRRRSHPAFLFIALSFRQIASNNGLYRIVCVSA